MAQLSTQDINDLPDSDFAFIESGGTKDSEGKTVPRSLRHYPIPDAAHVRNALSRIGQGSEFGDQAMPTIRKAAKKFGVDVGEDSPGRQSSPLRSLTTFTRDFDFELRSVRGGDGRTLEGYVAMFNSRARIPDRQGDFEEELHPGFADRSLAKGFPVMQFDHGKDPRVGTVPIGVYDTFDKDQRGYYVRGKLFDNPVVEPVKQAIQGGAIKGMSFRFSVSPNGDRWVRNRGSMDHRDVLSADVHEAGPVVFPAYAQTSVTVRSLIDSMDLDERMEVMQGLLAEMRELGAVDLTGRSAWDADGGDYDEPWPWEGGESTSTKEKRARQLAIALRTPNLPV